MLNLFDARYVNGEVEYNSFVGELKIDFRSKNRPIYTFGTRLLVGITKTTDCITVKNRYILGISNNKINSTPPFFSIFNFFNITTKPTNKQYVIVDNNLKFKITSQTPISTKNLTDVIRNSFNTTSLLARNKIDNNIMSSYRYNGIFIELKDVSYNSILPNSIVRTREGLSSKVEKLSISNDLNPKLANNLKNPNNYHFRNIKYKNITYKNVNNIEINDLYESYEVYNDNIDILLIKLNFFVNFKRLYCKGSRIQVVNSNVYYKNIEYKGNNSYIIFISNGYYIIVNRDFNLGRLFDVLPYRRGTDFR